MRECYDALVIGGGFFGLYIAEHLRTRLKSILLCEKYDDFMQRASYVNQARVHNGYHYPRSILTAFRSRVNYPRFCSEFQPCIDSSFIKLYAIGRNFSKVSAEQFRLFINRIGAPIQPAPEELRRLFDFHYIENVFLVEECAFDAIILKNLMVERVKRAGVETKLGAKVNGLHPGIDGGIRVVLDGMAGREIVAARRVFNCTYSEINQVLAASDLPLIPLKHELTEMALVEVPNELRKVGITVMCGPYFSTMPFPPEGMHTLSHVRYTPHFNWCDTGKYRDAHDVFQLASKETAYPHMIRDTRRYVPALAKCEYHGSLWEVKTVLPSSEIDDSRPILFRKHHGIPNNHVIMGGKIDNIYDAVEEIDKLLTENGN